MNCFSFNDSVHSLIQLQNHRQNLPQEIRLKMQTEKHEFVLVRFSAKMQINPKTFETRFALEFSSMKSPIQIPI